MSMKAMSWSINQKIKTPLDKLVLIMLADFHNGESGQCNPSISAICEKTGASRSTVKRALENLSQQGYIVIKSRAGFRGPLSNQYNFQFSKGVAEKMEDENFTDEAIVKVDEHDVESKEKPPADDKVINPWVRILGSLQNKINKHSFDTWFKPTRYSCTKGKTLVVRLPTPEFFFIKERYADLIQTSIKDLDLNFDSVSYELAADPERKTNTSTAPRTRKTQYGPR